MPLATGAVFAGYHIVRLLGSGASGEVYLAQHPRLPRCDALKIISAEFVADADFRERFTREADTVATLFHPHIVAVHDRGEFEGRLWIAMSYVDGTDAAQLMSDRFPAGMPPDDVCAIVTAVAEALDYANHRGLLHRDVKPANILLAHPVDGRRQILLADFGIVRPLGDVGGLTATNFALGTLAYAAPEQLMGARIDGRADQYGLAATTFHLLTGAPPFQVANPLAVIGRHLSGGPPRLSERRPELAHLDAVMAKALSKEPADRFSRCRDFAAALGRRASASSVNSVGGRVPTTRRRPGTATEFDPDPARADPFDSIVGELAQAGFVDVSEVGRGGFGVVYRCVQPQLGRPVAVKVLTTSFDRTNYERFRREVYVMGRVSGHPNIAAILHVGALASGRPYLVMPFYPGHSLDALVRRGGACDWAWALRVGVKLAGALETAHAAGILHHDVKPANVLLTAYSEPQLTDFGIARLVGGFETGSGRSVTGSLAFAAPEVLAGATPSVATDVYSLGATLFNLVAGHAAFERQPGEEAVAQFLRITTHEPPMLLGRDVPAGLAQLLKRVMARDPVIRPASAAEFGTLLRGLQREHGIPPDEMAIPATSTGPAAVVGLQTSLRDDERWSMRTTSVDGIPAEVDALPAHPQLPKPLTTFVGRRRELDEVIALLGGDARLVTLTGPGGVGKTRLAVHVATQLESSLPGGVWFVELGNVPEADHLIDVIADALSLGEQPGPAKNPTQDLARRLVRSLGARRALIVLDNCEHLIDVCGPLIEQLLSAVPDLQLLVTSQQVLGIAGEHIYAVAPLSLPDPSDIDDDPATLARLMEHEAIRLFIDRARAVVPGFTMTAQERLNVARLCAQLDGMPLVIELAAARLRTFGVTTLLQIIRDRFRLLSTGSSAAQPSHRTLQALVDWSYHLLTPGEREIWLATSLFAGEFNAEAVVELCVGPSLSAQDVRLLLASLIDKSMVVSTPRNGIQRYRLLVTLRAYAAERLAESGHRHEVVERYVKRYLRIAEELGRGWFSARQVELFNEVHEKRENLRAALAYCQSDDRLAEIGARIVTSLHYYWLASTTLTESRRWLVEVADSDAQAPSIRARALWHAGFTAVIQNDLDIAEQYASAACELAAQCGDHSAEGYANLVLGLATIGRNDVSTGIAAYQRALQCHRAEQDPEGVVATTSALITALAASGDAELALRMWQEAVAICERVGERWHLAYLMFARGLFQYFAGDYDQAAAAQLESLRLSRPFADRIVVAFALELLAWTSAQRGDYELAAKRLGAAAESWASGDISVVRYGTLTSQRRAVDMLIRQHLGEDRMAELREQGSRLGAEAAVAEALG
ncbi:protein kinase domain-containing protein [Mycobacterium decipiens]|nr:protein kinase [Mycobacterium decipiens]